MCGQSSAENICSLLYSIAYYLLLVNTFLYYFLYCFATHPLQGGGGLRPGRSGTLRLPFGMAPRPFSSVLLPPPPFRSVWSLSRSARFMLDNGGLFAVDMTTAHQTHEQKTGHTSTQSRRARRGKGYIWGRTPSPPISGGIKKSAQILKSVLIIAIPKICNDLSRYIYRSLINNR